MISKDLSHNFIESPIYHFGDKIAEICTPLFENFPINYFTYGYIDLEDKKEERRGMVMLTSDAKWIYYYLKNGHPIISRGKEIDCWQSIMSHKALAAAGARFNYYNGVVMAKIHSDYMEVLEFASPKLNQSPLEFCNNKDLLNRFLAYFKEKTKDVMISVENDPFYLPKDRFLKTENSSQHYSDFCEGIKTKRLSLGFKSKEVVFTPRQFEVLSLFIKGKRISNIAEILNISFRTVESHLCRAKKQANTYTVSQLLDCFSNSLF